MWEEMGQKLTRKNPGILGSSRSIELFQNDKSVESPPENTASRDDHEATRIQHGPNNDQHNLRTATLLRRVPQMPQFVETLGMVLCSLNS